MSNPFAQPKKTAENLHRIAAELDNLNTKSLGQIRASKDIAEDIKCLAEFFDEEAARLQKARTERTYYLSTQTPPSQVNLLPQTH